MSMFHSVTLPAAHSANHATIVEKAFALLLEWRARSRQRLDLLRLDDRMLRDVGLTRSDVCNEADKPFWRA